MNSSQIKPLLHYNVSLVFQQDIHLFQKQRKKTIRNLRLVDGINCGKPRFQQRTSLKLLQMMDVHKILQSLKFIRIAKLKDSTLISNEFATRAKMIHIVKRMSRVRSISMRDEYKPGLSLSLIIWLRYTITLQNIEYMASGLRNNKSLNNSNTVSKTKKLFTLINRVKIKALNIDAGYIHDNESCFAFQKYPSSLDKLSFSSQAPLTSEKPKIQGGLPFNLSDLSHLMALRFAINDSDGIMVHLLNSILDLSHLETLELLFKDPFIDTLSKLDPFLNTLKKSKKLKSLSLSNYHYKSLKSLFEAVNSSDLTEFSFTGYSNDSTELQQLIPFINCLAQVECLSLKFKHHRLQTLPQISKDLTLSLKRLLEHVRLRSFEFENFPDWIEEPSYFLEDVLDIFAQTAPFLKTLRINVQKSRSYSSPHGYKIMQLLNSLKEIEILDLPTADIYGEENFKDLVDWACRMQNLRVLRLGEVQDFHSQEVFINLVNSVLSKRGLEEFHCLAPAQIATIDIYDENGDAPYIDLKLVKHKNPFLESYPKFTYYDSDFDDLSF